MANKGAALHRVEVCKNLKHLNWVVWFYSGQMAFLEVPTTEVFMCHGKQVGMTIMVSNRLEKQLSREKIYTLNEPHFYEPTPHFLRDLLASLKISIEISQRTE